MSSLSVSFKEKVCHLVSQIPKGKVMTYGQIASLCGNPRAARIVGGIAHYGNNSLPWQRVVKKDGSLAEGFPGGVEGHERALSGDGIEMTNGRISIKDFLWTPNQ